MSGSSVELERLQATVDTQTRHIRELQKQLHEAQEVKRQQQLQLMQASPARRHVRSLMERAAAENTALCRKLEELRGQRNALVVTKAALTAQVSELIQTAVDDRQHDTQHRWLLEHVQQLARLVSCSAEQPHEQLAALAAFVKQAKQQQPSQAEPIGSSSSSKGNGGKSKRPAAAVPPSSPTGLRLDQTATSELIWTADSCPELFPPHQRQQQQQTKPHHQQQPPRSQTNTPSFGAWARAATAAQPGSPSAVTSYCTAHSGSLDATLGTLSPMRDAVSTGAGRQAGELTPCSRTPPPSGAADSCSTSPLSAQSLSCFSRSSPGVAHRTPPGVQDSPGGGSISSRPQLLSPLSRCTLASGGSPAAALPDQASVVASSTSAADAGGLCSLSGGRRDGAGERSAGPGKAGKSAGGLDLGPAFRLAAVDSLWASPAAAAAQRGGLSLQEGALLASGHDDAPARAAAEERDCWGPLPGSPSLELCPRALDSDFLGGGGADEGGEPASCATQQGHGRRRRALVSAAAALAAVGVAGGAFVMHHHTAPEHALRALAGAAGQHARTGLLGACRHVQHLASRRGRRGQESCATAPAAADSVVPEEDTAPQAEVAAE